jgi:hypothetical protein
MAICANCSSDALYVYQLSANYGINYCQRHLPSFLARGPQPKLFEAPAKEVEKPVKVKKTEAVAEVVEEVVEPVEVVEEDAPNT